MRLQDLKDAFPGLADLDAFKALYDPDQLKREFEAEVLSLATSEMSRADLVRHLAWIWVNYQAMHAIFERHVQDRAQIDSAHIEYVREVSSKAQAKAKSRHRTTAQAKDEMRRIWATGKYDTRDLCAEEEYAALGIKFSTARKALIGTPEPER